MMKITTFSLFAVCLLLLAAATETRAQEPPKYEIGLHLTSLNVTEKHDHDTGIGVRFTYNLNEYLGVEAEGNQLPQTREGGGNNETQGFFGARAGIRREKFGLFAKARPGFTRFYLLGINPGINTFEQGHTRFAMDVGGVFEVYPNRHVAIRVDAGDTMVNYKPGDFFYQRLDQPMPVSRQLSHNLQMTVGAAFRF